MEALCLERENFMKKILMALGLFIIGSADSMQSPPTPTDYPILSKEEREAIMQKLDDTIASQSTQLAGQKEYYESQLAEQSAQLAEQKEYYESQLAEQAAELKRLKEEIAKKEAEKKEE